MCTVRSLYSAVSGGSERLVLAGRVPADLGATMRVPYLGGDFHFPVKYGYSLVGWAVRAQGPQHCRPRCTSSAPAPGHLVVDSADIYPVPEDVPAPRAALASNMETAITAIWDARPSLGERVLVVGFGYIGALIGQILRGMPGIDLRIVELDEPRRDSRGNSVITWRLPGAGRVRPGDSHQRLAGGIAGSHRPRRNGRTRGGEVLAVEPAWKRRCGSAAPFTASARPAVASQVSHLPGFQKARWDCLRRKQLVFSFARLSCIDHLLSDPIPFDQLAEFFNHPPAAQRRDSSIGILPMKKVLLVSSANPYPVVTNGCEKLVLDYQRTIFAGYDVHFVATQPGTWAPLACYRGQTAEAQFDPDRLLQSEFAFAFFVGFRSNEFTRQVTVRMPSFCLTDTHPHPDVPEGVFRGILSHRVSTDRRDILHCGGSYDSEVFYPNRVAEEFVISIGRIHPG